MGTYKGHGKEN